MIRNVAITTPTIGRITIGEVYENGKGQRVPRGLNHFRITTQFKREGEWVEHPIQKAVLAAQKSENGKITSIPIKLMFNNPDLNVTSRLEAYNSDGQLVCAGDGEKARRVVDNQIESVECVGCDTCQFGIENRCDKFTRFTVLIDVESPEYPVDGFSGFIIRSRGHNTYKALTAKIERLSKLFKGQLTGIPMVLRLIGKSSRTSRNTPFFYIALDLAKDVFASAKCAKEHKKMLDEAEIDQAAYEAIALEQLQRGIFYDTEEDAAEVEEFALGFAGENERIEPLELLPSQDDKPEVGLNHLRGLIEKKEQDSTVEQQESVTA